MITKATANRRAGPEQQVSPVLQHSQFCIDTRPSDQSETTEIPRYIGQNSIPAILRDQPSPIDTKNGIDIRRDMRPIWGLDNSAPFPLMSTHHLDKMTQDISSELPSDREVLKYVYAPHTGCLTN